MKPGAKKPASSPKRTELLRELLRQLVCPSPDFEATQRKKAQQYKNQKGSKAKLPEQTLADLLDDGPQILTDEQLVEITTAGYASLEVTRNFVHTTADMPDSCTDF